MQTLALDWIACQNAPGSSLIGNKIKGKIMTCKDWIPALYGKDPLEQAKQKQRFENLDHLFKKNFREEAVYWFSTPGRSEIGGNHTDHNHGRVLAASINLDAIAAVNITKENKITVFSKGYPNPFVIDLADLSPKSGEKGTTTALIRGIAARFKELGFEIGGFNAFVDSWVLPGSGLSSSATIEVLIVTILNHLYNQRKIKPEIMAQIGQYAENNYFGKPCGLMDQMACAIGGMLFIDFENPQKPKFKSLPIDLKKFNYSLLVVNTGGSHADLTEDYASIPYEMKQVARFFGKDYLRQVDLNEFLSQIPNLHQKVSDRALLRAYHFLHENERVWHQFSALQSNDFEKFLDLVNESGNSSFKWLQNIFTTKRPEDQSLSLALALSENFIKNSGQGACRVHGGGFAGTIQVFLPNEAINSYRTLIEPVFGKDSVSVLQIRSVGSVCLNDFLDNLEDL